MREEQTKTEKQKEQLRQQLKYWKAKAQQEEFDKNFLYKQILETKKQNKLLKMSITRLQKELDEHTA